MRKYGLILAVSLVSSLFTVFLVRWFDRPQQVIWQSEPVGEVRYTGLVEKLLQAPVGSSAPDHFTTAAQIVTPTVVNIRALLRPQGSLWGGGSLTGSSGSGVIMSSDGYIITNYHVIERSSDIKVTLYDKREYIARLVGADPSTDIALIKINEKHLPAITFGNSDTVQVGEWVLAVGNPFNLESTVTAGIISAKGRNLNILGGNSSIESFIQTDAAVNPGNSGGALVNTKGELIGINTAIITESGSYEGYSFAVPSNLAQKVIRDLLDYGEVQRAFLGIGIQDLDSETARSVGLPTAEGVFVTRVGAESAAAAAGLQSGDVILGLNESRVRHTPELQEFVGRFRPGDQVMVEYWRSGSKYRVRVQLKNDNALTATSPNSDALLQREIGFELRDLTLEEQRRLRFQGAVVSSITRGSLVEDANMQPNFIITSVNGRRISNASEALNAIRKAFNQVNLDGYYEGEPDLYSYRFRKNN